MRPSSRDFILNFVVGIGSLLLLGGCNGGFTPTHLASNGAASSGLLTPEQKAFETIVRNDCNMCHGTRPGDGGVYLYDTAALVAAGWIVPGSAAGSSVYTNTGGGHHGRAFSPADRIVIADWIMSLASAPTPTPTPMPTATPPGATPTPTPIPLTKDEFFTANVGPNASSVNSLISVNRCANCHYSGGSGHTAAATNYLVISPLDPAGNLARLKAVRVGTNTIDLTRVGGGGNTLYQFATGHKAKSPAYSSAELQHIQRYVNMP